MLIFSKAMSAQQGVLKLLEVVETLRDEVIRRLDDHEGRLRKSISKEELASFMELQYDLTTAVVLGYYLQISTKSPNSTIYEFEENLRKLLRVWKRVIEKNRKLFGVVNWPLIQDGSSMILSATRTMGLPFGTVAGHVVEVMGADAEKFLSEASIAETYGTVNLTKWRRLMNR